MSFHRVWKSSLAFVAVLAFGFLLARGAAEENPIPWKFGGYEKIDELHLKYWSASRDALEDAENFAKPGFSSEISEIWYSKSSQSFRVDKYVEKASIKCNKFKGKEWETMSEGSKDYVLKERIIQSGGKRAMSSLENIMSGGGTELCEYKISESQARPLTSISQALNSLTLGPWLSDADSKELLLSGLEMDKLMDAKKYKETLKDLKTTVEKAGRKTVKWNTAHGIVKFMAEGFVYVDLDWGMALEGYVTKIQTGVAQPLNFSTPVCIYKVLSVETKIADPAVFNK
jgi:hypothetical protein